MVHIIKRDPIRAHIFVKGPDGQSVDGIVVEQAYTYAEAEKEAVKAAESHGLDLSKESTIQFRERTDQGGVSATETDIRNRIKARRGRRTFYRKTGR